MTSQNINSLWLNNHLLFKQHLTNFKVSFIMSNQLFKLKTLQRELFSNESVFKNNIMLVVYDYTIIKIGASVR